jgi:D-beta-D-heptose 7-phosphate kinase/D-beta-D-heptose 1-phosphate adenosyltransferase
MHAGHVRYFQFCRGLGDVLVVGVNSDTSIRAIKGEGRPILPLEERQTLLAALAAIDYVVAFDDLDPVRLISRLRPDVHVKGEDYKTKKIIERETVESYGGEVVLAPLWPGVSTSTIIERVSARTGLRGESM